MNVDPDTLLVLKSSTLGEGEPDLGEKLLKAFLSQLLESNTLPAKVICLNSGVFLTTEGSAVLPLLQKLAEAGTAIASCGTCLDYYGRKELLRVGEVGNMRDTVNALQSYKRVIQP